MIDGSTPFVLLDDARPGAVTARLSAKARLGISDAYKPIF